MPFAAIATIFCDGRCTATPVEHSAQESFSKGTYSLQTGQAKARMDTIVSQVLRKRRSRFRSAPQNLRFRNNDARALDVPGVTVFRTPEIVHENPSYGLGTRARLP